MDPKSPAREAEPHAYREFERAGWEKASSAYADTFEGATRLFVGPLADAARIGSGARVLDVACGTGCFAAEAARRGAAVVGLDFSPPMVAEARRLHPTLRFEAGDAEALPFPDNEFDAVGSNFGVHHFPFPQRALAEARRVLRPGGRLAFTVWASPADHMLHRIALDAVRRAGGAESSFPAPPDGSVNEPDRCVELMRAAGFHGAAPTVGKVSAALELASVEELERMILQGTVRMAALISTQPAERRAAILAAVAEEAARYAENGRLRIPVVALLASAVK